MTQTGFIAVIDIGTYAITAVIGRRNENNVISITASESVATDNCVRRGIIYNIDVAGGKIKKLISLLENKLDRKIGQIYVALSGQSLQTVDFTETRQLPVEGIVTEHLIKELHESAKRYQPDLMTNYAIADVGYSVDGKSETKPVGVTGRSIEARFKIVIGRPNILLNIKKAVTEKAGIEVAGFIVGQLSGADISLSDEDKELGCAFINFGAGTSSLSVYKGGALRRMVVIPFGGQHITKDICQLNFTQTDAEKYKVNFGKAKEGKASSLFSSPFSSKPNIDLVELDKVIAYRLNEIVSNIEVQINQTGLADKLGAGIIITGGGSLLKNLDIYLKDRFNSPVRTVTARKTSINNSPDLCSKVEMTQVLGMLLKAEKNCEKIIVKPIVEEEIEKEGESIEEQNTKKPMFGGIFEKKEKKKKPNKESAGSKMKDLFSGFFSEGEDDD